MIFLGSCRCYIIFIYTLLINGSFIKSLGEILPGYENCFIINNSLIFNTSTINNQIAEELIKNGNTNSTDGIPEAPRDLKIVVQNGKNPTIEWLTHPFVTQGLFYLRHILVKVVQEYTSANESFKDTEYTLLNVTGKDLPHSVTMYDYNCTQFKPGAYHMEAVLWFFGELSQSADGHLTAKHNDKSMSEGGILGKWDIIPALRNQAQETDTCICLSTISIDIKARPVDGIIASTIQGANLPDDINVEIQLIRKESFKYNLVTSLKVSGKDIKDPYMQRFNVSRGKHYFIRVLRFCAEGYFVSCGKDEADIMRSETVFLGTGSSYSSHGSTSRPKDSLKQVMQIAFINFAFGTCILAELALIIRLTTALLCHQKTSARNFRRTTYVRLGRKGKPVTKLVKRNRVAIIFTKDSTEHEKRVHKICDELRNLAVEAVKFDEATTPEMRTNWIQAAEDVVAHFEAILFVISTQLYNICKKGDPRPCHMREENNASIAGVSNKFPAVVLSALKNGNAWGRTGKAKVISVCIAETKQDCKQLAIKMRREHPIIFKDKIYFHRLRQKYETETSKSLRKLINQIISSL